MIERLEEFAQLLRQNGLRLSPAETADAARALALLDLDDQPAFHAGLRATLVKRGSDAPVFDRLFALFWSGAKDLIDGLDRSLLDGLELEKLDPETLEHVAETLAQLQLAPLTQALLQGRQAELARLLRQATLSLDFRGLQSPLQRSFYARRVLNAAGAPETERDLRAFSAELRARGVDEESSALVQRELGDKLQALEEAARRVAEREQQARDPASRAESGLAQRSLASLSPQEIERMRALVQRLAEKLKDRLSRRRKQRRRGALSVRRTLRANLALGGLPARLIFRARRPQRPELVILCDVSDSVRNVSRLMLQFVHGVQKQYARVRSFVFVSDLGEVTHLFQDVDVSRAIDRAFAGAVINLAANSNYGNALAVFERRFLASVNRRTSVIVIGDGRGNYNPPNPHLLDAIKRRARRLLWICPEDQASWGFGDSEMPAYARRCDQTLVVKTMDDLARAADLILP